LIDLSIARTGESNPRIKMDLALRDIAFVKSAEPQDELPPDNEIGPDSREEISGTLIGEIISQSGLFAGTLDSVTMEIMRRLNQLVEGQFDEARRLAASGLHELALEESIRFLFLTPEFDLPQAEEANQQVIASLGFSILDWLWGEPEMAVVESGMKPRRLPLGFRRAPGESSNGELPRTIICLRDGSEMVLIPGGTELMGNESGNEDARPAHPVALSPYYIDKFETSVAQYERFIAAMAHRVPQPDDPSHGSQWEGRAAKKEKAGMPVVYVNWHDARAYAQWAGKSLPTEAQWERAARGGFDPDYPQSLDPAFDRHVNARPGEDSKFRSQNSGSARSGGDLGQLVSVYSFPTALTPFGCQNMLGNVAEWCRDWHDPTYYASGPADDPLGPDQGDKRVVRGGSWQTSLHLLGPAVRDAEKPAVRSAAIGFRCVLNLPK
jgi:formylglycine-generating enzyme required for sulfatase activity